MPKVPIFDTPVYPFRKRPSLCREFGSAVCLHFEYGLESLGETPYGECEKFEPKFEKCETKGKTMKIEGKIAFFGVCGWPFLQSDRRHAVE
jgi:hypothetical protein